MAGDWIKVETVLPDKPEVWQISGMLGLDPDAVVGKLFKVWRWFDAHTENGNAFGVTYALVDSTTGVTGFAEAMALAGWLEQDGAILRLPHFDRHNGKTAKNRALTAKRVASYKEKSNAEGNGVSVTSALPREEKRREEKEHTQQGKPAADPEQSVSREQRLAQVTDDAIAAYNAKLAKPGGLLAKVSAVGRDKRRQQVGRCVKVAREICQHEGGDGTVTPDFWETYFGICAEDDFLAGRGPYTNGHTNWLPDFEYLTRPATMAKVYERTAE